MEAKSGTNRWFEVIYVAVVIALLAIGIRWMGRGRVGVVDVPRVVTSLGMQSALADDVASLRQQTMDQVQTLRQEWEADTEPLRQAFEVAGDEVERRRLRGELEQRQMQLEAKLARLRHEMQQQQRSLLADFRGSIAPAVQAAARAARVDIVIETGPALLYRRDSVDLTEAVIRHGHNLVLSASVVAPGAPEDADLD